eukprot:COSAG01_NODE_6349_length_3720_cov_32.132836_5_plen_186_part_00
MSNLETATPHWRPALPTRARRCNARRRLPWRVPWLTLRWDAGKGGKSRRRGKNEGEEKRELTFKEDGQEYAQVVRMLGNGRLEAMCFDGKTRLGHIRGKMRKKIWINQGDFVLCGLRDFQDEKCDIIAKYSMDEARNLKAYGELPEGVKINEDETFNEADDGACPFEFGDPDDGEEEGGVDLDEI